MSCKTHDPDELLRATGLRRTLARRVVLEALASAGRPMSHQQLAAVEAVRPIDKVTLYRTLATLRGRGLIHAVTAADGTARFCANRSGSGCPGGHPHFQCLQCGEMRCVTGQRLPRVSLDEDAVVQTKQLVASGMCARCARTPTRPGAR